jgi:hypothetical protein
MIIQDPVTNSNYIHQVISDPSYPKINPDSNPTFNTAISKVSTVSYRPSAKVVKHF